MTCSRSGEQKQILIVLSALTGLNLILTLGRKILLCKLWRKRARPLVQDFQVFLKHFEEISVEHEVMINCWSKEKLRSDPSFTERVGKEEFFSNPFCGVNTKVPEGMLARKVPLFNESERVLWIPINYLQKVLAIPLEALPEEETVREFYCYACIYNSPSVFLVDLWNILCSLLTFELRRNRGNTAFITEGNIGIQYHANLLATGRLLQRTYSLRKHVKRSTIVKEGFSVLELPHKLISQDKTFDTGKWSQIRAFLSYELVKVKSPIQNLLYISFFDSSLLRVLHWDTYDSLKTILLTDIMRGCTKGCPRSDHLNANRIEGQGEGSCGTLWSAVSSFGMFFFRLCQHSSRKLAVTGHLLSIANWTLTALQEAIKKDILDCEIHLLESTSLFALAMQNFVPSFNWGLPSLIEEAVHAATSFSEEGVNFILGNVMDLIEDVTTGLSHPLECAVAWCAVQFIRYLENKMLCIVALVSHCMSSFHYRPSNYHNSAVDRSAPTLSQGNDYFENPVNSFPTHLGLSLLLLVFGENHEIENSGTPVFSFYSHPPSPPSCTLSGDKNSGNLIALAYLALDMVFPFENSRLIQSISLPLCEWLICYYDAQQQKMRSSSDYVLFFCALRDDLRNEIGAAPVVADLSVTSHLFLLRHRSGIPFTRLSSTSSHKLVFNSETPDSASSRNARETVLEALDQCIGRADVLPLSLALAVSDALLSKSKNAPEELSIGNKSHKRFLISSLGSLFAALPFATSSSLSFASTCDRIQTFAVRFLPVVTPAEGVTRRLSNFVQYEHSLQRKGECSYSFHLNLLQTLCRCTTTSNNDFWEFTPLIDDRLWAESAPLDDTSWSLEFQNVCFSYPNSKTLVLDNVSFRVEASQKLGIIGYSGAGKTTILLLINRIYPPKSGTILINDKPIQQYAARAFRRRVSFAFQDTNAARFFESMDILSNIALGDLAYSTVQKIEDSLKVADAQKLVHSRGGGLGSALDFKKFSSGELERLNLARAVLRSMRYPSIFIQDESFCAFDSLTEERITKSLEEGWAKRSTNSINECFAQRKSSGSRGVSRPTVITVTHRLYSVQDSSLILLMVNGKIEERGTWNELLQSPDNKNFHKLLHSQQLHHFDYE